MVSKTAFRKLTDPGQPDPILVEMGFSLRQKIGNHQYYSLTGFKPNGESVVPIFVTVTPDSPDIPGRMIIDTSTWRVGYDFVQVDYDLLNSLICEFKAQFPDITLPDSDYQPDFESIPWDGEPMYNDDDEDDLGLEARYV